MGSKGHSGSVLAESVIGDWDSCLEVVIIQKKVDPQSQTCDLYSERKISTLHLVISLTLLNNLYQAVGQKSRAQSISSKRSTLQMNRFQVFLPEGIVIRHGNVQDHRRILLLLTDTFADFDYLDPFFPLLAHTRPNETYIIEKGEQIVSTGENICHSQEGFLLKSWGSSYYLNSLS